MRKSLTTTEAAAALQLNPSMVRRYIRMGRLRGRSCGRTFLIRAAEVAAFKPNKPGPVPKKILGK